MEKKKVHQDVVIGFVCLLITLFIFWINRNLAADAAMMPRLLAALLAFLSLLMIAEGVRKTKEAAVRNEEPKKYLDWDGNVRHALHEEKKLGSHHSGYCSIPRNYVLCVRLKDACSSE